MQPDRCSDRWGNHGQINEKLKSEFLPTDMDMGQ